AHGGARRCLGGPRVSLRRRPLLSRARQRPGEQLSSVLLRPWTAPVGHGDRPTTHPRPVAYPPRGGGRWAHPGPPPWGTPPGSSRLPVSFGPGRPVDERRLDHGL